VTVQQLRNRIDRLDDRMLTLLNQRGRLGLQVGRLKRRNGQRVFDRTREYAILKRLSALNRGPLSPAAVRAIYREILRQIRRLEQSA
jgi:chorismate mutase/prephenate dehydratase